MSEDSVGPEEFRSTELLNELKKLNTNTVSKIRVFFTRMRRDATGYPGNWREDFCEYHYGFQNSSKLSLTETLNLIIEFLAECMNQIEVNFSSKERLIFYLSRLFSKTDFRNLERGRSVVEKKDMEIIRSNMEIDARKVNEKKLKLKERVLTNELSNQKENINSK